MYLLYVDESGEPLSVNDQHFVLAGIGVFERQTYWLSQQLDALETELFGAPPGALEAVPVLSNFMHPPFKPGEKHLGMA